MTKPTSAERMRAVRTPNPANPKPHALREAHKGSPRKPGKYICSCGERFTSVLVYERHRAEARRTENGSNE